MISTIDNLILNIIDDLENGDMITKFFDIRNNIEDKFIISKSMKDLDILFTNAVKKFECASESFKDLKDKLEIEGLILDNSSFSIEVEKEKALKNKRQELNDKLDKISEEEKIIRRKLQEIDKEIF